MIVSKIAPYAHNIRINNSNCSFKSSGDAAGNEGVKLNVVDHNNLINYESVSDSKVGDKFIITFNDSKYAGLRMLYTPDSTFESETKNLKLSLQKKDDLSSYDKPSFTGMIYGSIGKNEKGEPDRQMMDAYYRFFDRGMLDNIVKNYTSKELVAQIKDDYNFFIPSDGEGSRYRDVTKLQENAGMRPTKPASYIPAQLNGEKMSLIHTVMTNFAKTGKLNEGPEFIYVKPAQGSAFAFLEGLKDGTVPTDKPLVFCWGDNFADLNVPKMILEHEKSNSGLSIFTIPVDKERVKALSAILVDNFDSRTIKAFVEKPTDPTEIAKFQLDELDGKILSSVSPYIFSKEALQWLKEEYTSNPNFFKTPDKGEYDLSKRVLTPLVEVFGAGEIKDEKDTPLAMKACIISKDETWSDLGAQKDFSAEMKKVKNNEAYFNLPAEIKKTISRNVDNDGNITFDEKSRKLLEQARREYGLELKNIIAYCS